MRSASPSSNTVEDNATVRQAAPVDATARAAYG
jgi:hypothetical protein